MRRTLALASAAILAAGLGGLASGSASASDSGITSNPDIEASEVAVDLDTTFQEDGLEGTFVELQNNTGSIQELDDYVVEGCNATEHFTILSFGTEQEISANGQFLIADESNFSGGVLPNATFAKLAEGKLNLDDGGVRLIDPNDTVVNGVRWGMPQHPACTSLDPAQGGASPTDTHSLNYDTSIDAWCAAPANPHQPSPSCAS